MRKSAPIQLVSMLLLQSLLLLGILATDFHYLLEHHDDEAACTALSGERHYHASDDDHLCFIGHLPGWTDYFEQIQLPAHKPGVQVTFVVPPAPWTPADSRSVVTLRGPPISC